MATDWHFRKFRPGDTINDPIERALFSQESVTGHPASALVREAIQNSLDARPRNAGRATVRFTLHRGATAPSMVEAASLLDSLMPRLTAPQCGLEDAPARSGSVPLLLIEDFGTLGLTGDSSAWEPTDARSNPFFLFFRALGRSGKTGEQRGRWGVGKFVFPLASRANCWFGYTLAGDSPRELLMGRCVIKTHQLGGSSWHPDGTWGIRRVEDEFVLPATSSSNEFGGYLRTLRLDRRTRAGLSVVIPWVRDEVTVEAIRNAVVREYFLPIIRGDLEVHVGSGSEATTLISDSSLNESVARVGDSALTELVDLAREGERLARSGFVEVPEANYEGYPQWRDELLSDSVRDALSQRLESGEPVMLRLPFRLRPKGGSELRTHIDVVLRESATSAPLAPLVVREGITIPDAKPRRLHGHVCLILVDDGPIASLVGDAESPSHTHFLHELLKDKYTFGKRFLAFVREAPAGILKTLAGSANQEDPFLLASFFPAREEGHARTPRKTRKRGTTTPIPDPPPRKPARYHVRRVNGGFTVAGVAETVEPPKEISIAVAYEVRKGNPLRKYRPFDFSFTDDSLAVSVSNAHVVEKEGNSIRVAPQSPDFQFSVTGFDEHRNLFVRVTDR